MSIPIQEPYLVLNKTQYHFDDIAKTTFLNNEDFKFKHSAILFEQVFLSIVSLYF